LQRVEDFPGLIILASNFKSNIDAAFLRRFSSIIEFPFPKPAERLKLWKKAMPEKIKISDGVNLTQLAEKYELSGSTINQVVYYASLQMYHLNLPAISQELLVQGIQRELKKEDKVLR
jgi:SpoVK/Ycf46/Vps4 family AAA+-type ATPase